MKWVWVVAAVALATTLGGRARAGCLNVCAASAEPVTVTPPLDCATIQATAETCDCALFVSVINGCAGPLEATGFTWDSCQTGAGTGMMKCAAIEAGGRGAVRFRADKVGRASSSLGVRTSDGDHTIATALNVTSFDNGGCAIAPAPRETVPRLVASLLVVVGLTIAASRCRPRGKAKGPP